jgi:hypothetical protein
MKPWLPLLTALLGHPSVARSAPAEARLEVQPADEDLPRGCGWFDSSHELHCGLSVQEHASPDTLARELPLTNWLELHLSGWAAATPAV